MDVYLVPVGVDKHELYCEVPDDEEPTNEASAVGAAPDESEHRPNLWRRLVNHILGFFRRMRDGFYEMLAEAERERREARTAAPEPATWWERSRRRTMRWVAESIAEQRLLWHLRKQTAGCLYYPDDLDEAQAMGLLRGQLKRDFERHRFWLTIDGLGFVASGVAFFVPGPNVIAYYFAFRLVGHYFSLRGARQGMSFIEWTPVRSEALGELRRAIAMTPAAREQRVNEVATRLRLEHLASFVERTAVPS
jgi:Mitochondrial K+-H+ exchange-related